VANVLLSEVGGRLKALGLEQEQSPVSMAGIVQAADLLDEGKISSKQLKQLFDVCFEKGEDFPLSTSARSRADHRRLGHRGADRRGDRRQSQTGGTVPRRQKDDGGILCGPGDARLKGQANPALLNELVAKSWRGEAAALPRTMPPYSLHFIFSSHSNSLRASQELTVLVALFLPSFSAHRSKSSAMLTWAKRNRPLLEV
jgi:hypothetical protein